MAPIILRYDRKLKFSSCGDDFFFTNYIQINNIILEFPRENTSRVSFLLKIVLTPLGCFLPKRRFENQKPTKTKKQAKCFRLLLIYFVPGIVQLSLFFLQDLEKLRVFNQRLKTV